MLEVAYCEFLLVVWFAIVAGFALVLAWCVLGLVCLWVWGLVLMVTSGCVFLRLFAVCIALVASFADALLLFG